MLKLKHIKNFKSFFERKLIQIKERQTVSGRSLPPAGAKGKTFIEKRPKPSKEVIWLAVAYAVAAFGEAGVAVYDWLSLGFDFLILRHLQA